MAQYAIKSVPCPRCGALAPFTPENPWRPFCSERCKLIDLGNWACESYRVPDPGTPPGDPEPHDA
ncbi:MAG TPA: DNA gyrase inhibitor YacG [Burkholderiales bacterium]|nr:DNA gyrase inhibitor YacG [Burkholderiales bacterium]